MKALSSLFIVLLPIVSQAAAHPKTHLVIAGDTLHRIAREHRCTIATLKATNGLKNDIIRIGQTLKVPAVPAATASTPAAPAPKPPAPVTLADHFKAMPFEDRMKAQLFLDDALFAPGKVDGLMGEFTTKAAERWIAAAPGRDFETLMTQAREKIPTSSTTFTIPESAAKRLGFVPGKTWEKAALTTLPYETLAEYTAERFHTDLSTLRRLNPGLNLDALKIGDSLQVPAVKPFVIESWPDKGISARTAPEGIHLCIQHDTRMIEVLRADGSLCAAFPITVSPKPEHRRAGEWYIRSLAANPSFLWDDELLKNGIQGKKQHLLPPGPNNPVGILWLEIEPVGGPEAHIGIHGTADPARIGRNHSSGCIRLANWDIVRLAKLVGKGTRVTWTLPATEFASTHPLSPSNPY